MPPENQKRKHRQHQQRHSKIFRNHSVLNQKGPAPPDVQSQRTEKEAPTNPPFQPFMPNRFPNIEFLHRSPVCVTGHRSGYYLKSALPPTGFQNLLGGCAGIFSNNANGIWSNNGPMGRAQGKSPMETLLLHKEFRRDPQMVVYGVGMLARTGFLAISMVLLVCVLAFILKLSTGDPFPAIDRDVLEIGMVLVVLSVLAFFVYCIFNLFRKEILVIDGKEKNLLHVRKSLTRGTSGKELEVGKPGSATLVKAEGNSWWELEIRPAGVKVMGSEFLLRSILLDLEGRLGMKTRAVERVKGTTPEKAGGKETEKDLPDPQPKRASLRRAVISGGMAILSFSLLYFFAEARTEYEGKTGLAEGRITGKKGDYSTYEYAVGILEYSGKCPAGDYASGDPVEVEFAEGEPSVSRLRGSNEPLQMPYDMHIAGYFALLFIWGVAAIVFGDALERLLRNRAIRRLEKHRKEYVLARVRA